MAYIKLSVLYYPLPQHILRNSGTEKSVVFLKELLSSSSEKIPSKGCATNTSPFLSQTSDRFGFNVVTTGLETLSKHVKTALYLPDYGNNTHHEAFSCIMTLKKKWISTLKEVMWIWGVIKVFRNSQIKTIQGLPWGHGG